MFESGGGGGSFFDSHKEEHFFLHGIKCNKLATLEVGELQNLINKRKKKSYMHRYSQIPENNLKET